MMNVVLQRHGARQIYVVPEGLRELMSDISREVLRSQPFQIYGFVADYLDALMVTRENARVAARVVESLTDCSATIAFFLEHTGMTRSEAEKKAKIIQQSFRAFLERKRYPKMKDPEGEQTMIENLLVTLEIPLEKLEEAATIIADAFRAFKERQMMFQEDQEFINWREAMRNTMFVYKKAGASEEELHRAATTIKAAYKGYYTRRYMRPGGTPNNRTISEEFNNMNVHFKRRFRKMEDAAILIQYWVRRYFKRTGKKSNIVMNMSPVPSTHSTALSVVVSLSYTSQGSVVAGFETAAAQEDVLEEGVQDIDFTAQAEDLNSALPASTEPSPNVNAEE